MKDDTLEKFRSVLLAVIALGLAGTGVELLLLGHTETPSQLIPVILMAAGLIVILWHYADRRASTVRALQVLMALFVAAGVVGIALHYNSNVEFELEMYPNIEGMELFKKAISGAMPALAPGAMIQLGLLGLLYTFRHPANEKGE